ncbi:MAG: phosphodiesterase, partial [Candidatus Bipolaricaulia bacterium]
EPPDLRVYFGNLYWRSSASVGLGSIYLGENDTGPDHANHDWEGIFIFYDPKRNLGGRGLEGLELCSVAPTILRELRIPIPKEIKVKPIEVS